MASMTSVTAYVPEDISLHTSMEITYGNVKKIADVCKFLRDHNLISIKYFTRVSQICNFDSIVPEYDESSDEDSKLRDIRSTYHDLKFMRIIISLNKHDPPEVDRARMDKLFVLIKDYGFNTDIFGILTIGIYLHGEIVIDEKGHAIKNKNYPVGIYMRKKTVAAIGCVSKDIVVRQTVPSQLAIRYPSPHITLTHRAVYALEDCINRDAYLRIVNLLPPEKRELHKDEGCFALHEGKTEYYEKKFNQDGNLSSSQLIFMLESGAYIDMMKCSVKEFVHFFSQGEDTALERLFSLLEVRRTHYITTSDLHALIRCAQRYLSIKNVNILDNSCSVMRSITNDPADQCVLCPGYSKSCNGFIPDPSVGWGGKSRRKRRKRTRGKKR